MTPCDLLHWKTSICKFYTFIFRNVSLIYFYTQGPCTLAPLKPVLVEDPKFRGYLSASRYTLCIGAGISRGIAPDWRQLTQELLSYAFGRTISTSAFDEMLTLGWSLDALIQAAANEFNRTGRSNADFSDALESCLYSEIKNKAKGMGLDKYLVSVLNRPKSEPRDRIIEVCDFLENSFPDCSLFKVGDSLSMQQIGSMDLKLLYRSMQIHFWRRISIYIRGANIIWDRRLTDTALSLRSDQRCGRGE